MPDAQMDAAVTAKQNEGRHRERKGTPDRGPVGDALDTECWKSKMAKGQSPLEEDGDGNL